MVDERQRDGVRRSTRFRRDRPPGSSALQLIAGIDTTGYAHELGAGTTARLLTFRYRIDATKARRDVYLATALGKYPAVAAALPTPTPR